MFKVAIITILVAVVSAQYQHAPAYGPAAYKAGPAYAQEVYAKPSPYSFGYDVNDGYGTTQHHKEDGDDYGNKRGSYGYTDAYGIYRQVDYVADEYGFRASIRTNEPGTGAGSAAHSPADVHLEPIEPPQQAYHAPAYAQAKYAAPVLPAYAPKYAAPVLPAYAPKYAEPAYAPKYTAPVLLKTQAYSPLPTYREPVKAIASYKAPSSAYGYQAGPSYKSGPSYAASYRAPSVQYAAPY